MIGYVTGPRGVQPKLKLKIETFVGLPETTNLSLSKLIDRIILRPLSSALALSACAKMVESLGYPELKDRIKRSAIPYRA
jgi:hypothetical protein